MFKLDDEFNESDLSFVVDQIEKNYVLQINDRIGIAVYTNKGERIIDPNLELNASLPNSAQRIETNFEYLVQTDGTIKLPIIGQIKLDSLTLNQAEDALQSEYNKYYKDSFVKLSYKNKRVILLGGVGGQIIPLENENISLVEILAVAGGLDIDSKAHNIKLIRGGYKNAQVFRINLSTIDGMKKSMLDVEPGDIIYVEPWRRPWLEATRDFAPLVSLITSTLALVLVLQNL